MTLQSHFRIAVAAAALSAAAVPGSAQRSAYQSSDGQTSLYLDHGAAVILNFGDSKFSFGANSSVPLERPRANPAPQPSKQPQRVSRKLVYGFEVFGKASSGQTTVLSSKLKTPEGGAAVIWGIDRLSTTDASSNAFDRLLLDVGYSRSSFYAAPGPQPVDSVKQFFHRYRAMGVYNRLFSQSVMLGVAGGVERRNNLDDLQEVTFQSTLKTSGSDSVVKQHSGYMGAYSQYRAAPLYADLLCIVKNKVPFGGALAVDFFARSDLAPSHRYGDGGVGFFITKDGAPTKALAGVTASWNEGKIRVALVASYTF